MENKMRKLRKKAELQKKKVECRSGVRKLNEKIGKKLNEKAKNRKWSENVARK